MRVRSIYTLGRLLCALAVMPLWCAAAKPYSPVINDPMLEPWRWREIDALKGLGVLCMDQAPSGVVWFGTIECLVAYDGIEVVQIPFDEELMSLITAGDLRPRADAILVLDEDRVLAVIGRSLVLREKNRWKLIIPVIGVERVNTCLQRAEDGSVWLSTRKTLWCISEDLSEVKVVEEAPGDSYFSAFCMDPSGRAWVARTTLHRRVDLLRVSFGGEDSPSGNQRRVRRIPVVRPGTDAGLAVGPDGRVWYADSHGPNDLYVFDAEHDRWESTLKGEAMPIIFSMTVAADGTVWAGGFGSLYAIRAQGVDIYSRSQLGLPSVPLKFYAMQDGQCWVIGRVGHVYHIDTSTAHWKTYRDLHYEAESADGSQWFISEEGRIVSYHPQTESWWQYGVDVGVVEQPRNITYSSHGFIWVAGEHNGRAAISVFDGKTWQRYLHPEFAVEMSRGAAMETAESTLWFGAAGQMLMGQDNAGGLLEYGVSETGVPYLVAHHSWPPMPYYIVALARSSDGTMWMGAQTLHRWVAGAGEAEQVSGLPGMTTHEVIVDDEDAVWIARAGSGLYRKQKNRSEWNLQNVGIASEHVVDLLKLNDGTILAASENGISRFDGQAWAEHVFNADFAMAKNGGQMRQASDGSLWLNYQFIDIRTPLASRNPAFRHFTIRYTPETDPPETGITLYPDRVLPPGNVHIVWSGVDAYDRTPADRLQFSWRFNKGDWSPFSKESGKSFLGMASGQYTFEVRARDNDFNVDPTPSSCRFTVVAPIWRQSWFLMLVFTFIILVIFLLWMLVYIWEKYLLEKQAVREKHLMEMDQMKTSFFINISHELNTPLSLITEPLKLALQSEIAGETRERISLALRSADRVSTLVSQLLDLRKLELGKMKLNTVAGDLQQQVQDSLDLLQPLAQKHRVALLLEGPAEFRGRFDQDKLRKIIQNLVTNALKYTPPGGHVHVSVNHMQGNQGSTLCLTVEDSGIGIEPEHLRYIFDRFYRVPEKTIIDGSGIGLNLAKELVDLWGGEIRVESPIHDDPERPGSRFTVLLPITELISGENGDECI